jgi:hypothetical protein
MASREGHDAFAKEIQRERGATLARVTQRLEAALLDLERAAEALAAQPRDGTLRALHDEAQAHAAEALWFVVVHREAMGLTRHEILDEVYRIPRRVHLAMGPRRGR